MFEKNEKLELLKEILGTREDYTETVKNLDLDEKEKEILLLAFVHIKKKNIDQKLIDQAYDIVVKKSMDMDGGDQNTDDGNVVEEVPAETISNHAPFSNRKIQIPKKPRKINLNYGLIFVVVLIIFLIYQNFKDEQSKEREKRLSLTHKENIKSSTNNMTYRAYKIQRLDKPTNVSVLAWMRNYYNWEYRGMEDSYYSIAMKEGVSRFDGYVRINSDAGRRIFEVLKDGYSHEITVKIHFPSRKGWLHDYVVIDKLIAKD